MNISTLEWKKQTINPVTGEKSIKTSTLKLPTLGELLETRFKERKYLMFPWLREQESVMVYADTGVGKSMFALSLALAVAGGGEFLGWRPQEKDDGEGWRVLYVDGEMHGQDIQERAALLLDTIPGINRQAAMGNIRFLPRQLQEPGQEFPCITDTTGMDFLMRRVMNGRLDLIILDNFSTLGEVEDENAASSFNAIQDFLLRLKTTGVATLLVHHAGKSGDFRGSSKLAATFETIIKLERLNDEKITSEAQFRVRWDKVRAGGPKKTARAVVAKLTTLPTFSFEKPEKTVWEYEASDLDRLEDFKERLQAGEFVTLTEAATFYDTTKMSISRWKDKGIRLGLWTKEDVGFGLAKGKRLRSQGKTSAPIKRATDGEFWDEPEDTSREPTPDF